MNTFWCICSGNTHRFLNISIESKLFSKRIFFNESHLLNARLYFLQFYKVYKHLCKKKKTLSKLRKIILFISTRWIFVGISKFAMNTFTHRLTRVYSLFVIFEKLKKKKEIRKKRKIRYTVSRFIALLRARVNGIFSIYKYFTHLIHVNISKIRYYWSVSNTVISKYYFIEVISKRFLCL